MQHHLEYLRELVGKGGPDVDDYYDLDAWLIEISEQAKTGRLNQEEIRQLREVFGPSLSLETMQGFVYHKPHGYAGDYEIIDRIYRRYVSEHPQLSKWDLYMQQHAGAEAVRNRGHYLSEVLTQHVTAKAGQRVEVLNLASGPGRDMLLYFDQHPQAPVHFDCVEQDEKAVGHAAHLCSPYLEKISFHVRNALRFNTEKHYDLIWSAGLFDYFEDKVFVFMLDKLRTMMADGGEIVIGNFSTTNPGKHYMELFEWHLKHRSPQSLKALARATGFEERQISVRKEQAGVNLFLHIRYLKDIHGNSRPVALQRDTYLHRGS